LWAHIFVVWWWWTCSSTLEFMNILNIRKITEFNNYFDGNFKFVCCLPTNYRKLNVQQINIISQYTFVGMKHLPRWRVVCPWPSQSPYSPATRCQPGIHSNVVYHTSNKFSAFSLMLHDCPIFYYIASSKNIGNIGILHTTFEYAFHFKQLSK